MRQTAAARGAGSERAPTGIEPTGLCWQHPVHGQTQLRRTKPATNQPKTTLNVDGYVVWCVSQLYQRSRRIGLVS